MMPEQARVSWLVMDLDSHMIAGIRARFTRTPLTSPITTTALCRDPRWGAVCEICGRAVEWPNGTPTWAATLEERQLEGWLAVQPSEITDVLDRPISQELLARDVTRLAYVAKDGTPRSIPIGFTWNGSAIVMCTAKNAAKVPALRHNPAVALTIDTEVHPPRVLLIRGRAELDIIEGIPDEYLEMNGTYTMTPEQRVEWEADVRSLYDGMVRIVVVPTWAKLLDFETTLPSAVEELARQRDERQRA